MYAYITGVVTYKNDKLIVVENNNIGFYIQITEPNDYVLEQSYKVIIHHYIKEDVNVLYGFNSFEEKEFFVHLLSVSGIGPKSAFSIIAKKELDKTKKAITDGNSEYLKTFPGIGAKAAGQIILQLQTKFASKNVDDIDNPKLNNISDALISLGYVKKDILEVLKNFDYTLEESHLLKMALIELSKFK